MLIVHTYLPRVQVAIKLAGPANIRLGPVGDGDNLPLDKNNP